VKITNAVAFDTAFLFAMQHILINLAVCHLPHRNQPGKALAKAEEALGES